MAGEQCQQLSHHCRKPHQPWPQQLSPLFLLLVVLLIAGTSLPTASSSAMSVRGFWNSELPSMHIRQSLSNRLSSLSPEPVFKFLLDFKTGLLSSLREVLCDVGDLQRNRNAGDILIRETPQRNSTLHNPELFVGNQISLPQIQSRLRGVMWVLKEEEQNVPWRNEKFHGLDHTGTNSDNIFNLQVNKNVIQNKGDVNFNPINVNNTSGNKSTAPAPPPPQEEARTQENDTASAPSGATGSSHSSPNSNLATGDNNSNLTTGTAGSQNPQADSNSTSQSRNPNPSTNSTSDESPNTNPSSAHLSQMGASSKTPNSSTTAGNSDEAPDTNLSIATPKTKSLTANPATNGTSEESPDTTPSSGHDSQTGDTAKPKFPTTNPTTTGTSDESPDTNSSSNQGTPQVGGGGGGTAKNKPTLPA